MYGDACGGCPTLHLSDLESRFEHGRREDLTNSATVENAGQTLNMIGMKVSQDNGIQYVNVQPRQTTVNGLWVRPCVDHHRVTGTAGQDQRVTLTDVAGHHPPVR